MKDIKLITSIAPNISRSDNAGLEFGSVYQQKCIDSWRRAGFDPISVNSINEIYNNKIDVVRVHRDASNITGKPHPYLSDLLDVARNESRGEHFALTNSDVMMPPDRNLVNIISKLKPGEFVFSKRIDIDHLDQQNGEPFAYGYDFFAGHSNNLTDLSDAGFIFGAPWWDHFLPILMLRQGCKIQQIQPAVLHLNHTERWSMPIWETLGTRFIAEIRAETVNDKYQSKFENAIKRNSGKLLSDIRYKIWKYLPQNAPHEHIRMLNRVSDQNVSFLDSFLN